MKKAYAYIDGFSLYKGALEKRPEYKWLNLVDFCQSRMPDSHLEKIYYFTARIKNRFPGDDAHNRQHKYLRVLKDQGIEIVEGKFLKDSDWMRLVEPNIKTITDPNLPRFFGLTEFGIKRIFNLTSPDVPKSFVWKYGEKGSDVNLASFLLRDVYTSGIEEALVLSGDSDLATPIRIAKDCGVMVRTLHPKKGASSSELKMASSKFEELHLSWLAAHLLPNSYITKNGGNIVRPNEWK